MTTTWHLFLLAIYTPALIIFAKSIGKPLFIMPAPEHSNRRGISDPSPRRTDRPNDKDKNCSDIIGAHPLSHGYLRAMTEICGESNHPIQNIFKYEIGEKVIIIEDGIQGEITARVEYQLPSHRLQYYVVDIDPSDPGNYCACIPEEELQPRG